MILHTVTHDLTRWRFSNLEVFWPVCKILQIECKTVLDKHVRKKQLNE